MNADTLRRGVVNVEALFSADSGDESQALECQVVREDALTLDIEDVGHYTLMWTPTGALDIPHGYTFEDGVLGDIEQPEGLALALGFSLSEGIISRLEDLKSVAVCPDNPGVIRIQLNDPDKVQIQRRNVVINSSCGICGPREIIDDNALGLSQVTESLKLARDQFVPLMTGMQEQQGIFERTGGSHAAAIFDASGEVIAVAEDLGRHNALDKAIGLALMERGSVAGFGTVLSSRLSLEMVVKAVRTDLEVMLAVSAPTSLAVEVAQHYGVTLCGFVRDERATIYSHPHRITSNP
jgi:FdhD protein